MKRVFCSSVLLAGLMALPLPQIFAGASQFIENMPMLSPDPERAGAMIWEKPGLNRASYTKVMLDPITIFISPDSEYKGINAEELKKIADRFTQAITKALEPDIPVIDEKGPGVLYVRAALTNMKVAKISRGLLEFSPFGLLVDSSAGPPYILKETILEIEMIDSMSGERMAVLVDKAPGGLNVEKPSWNAVNKTLVFYAERFKARIEADRKKRGNK